MSTILKRKPRGQYDEYETHYISNADGETRVYCQLTGSGKLPQKERAFLAMQRAERAGRTDSPSYAWARQIYIHRIFGGQSND